MQKLTLTDDEFEALKAKHGRVTRVATPAGDIAFRAPTMAEENAFQASRFGGQGHSGMAWRNLMVTIVVFPDQPTFQKVLAEWPALNINTRVTSALQVLRGEVNEDEVK